VEADEVVRRLRAGGSVFAEREAELLLAAPGDVEALVARRVVGERLEDVLGWAAFAGRRYVVAPGVFVPRHRSTALVDAAAAHVRPGDTVLDLGCGTGALVGALTDRVPGLVVHAVDLLPAATACARVNLPGAHVHTGDLFDAVPAGLRFDAVLANVPYVPSAEIAHLPAEMREHEDRRTLDGGTDGLDVLRRVLAAAGERLTPRGRLFTELDAEQTGPAVAWAREHGLDAEVLPVASGVLEDTEDEQDEEDGSRVVSVRVGTPQVAMSTNRE
jgi:release factor glutamine methyltransferase